MPLAQEHSSLLLSTALNDREGSKDHHLSVSLNSKEDQQYPTQSTQPIQRPSVNHCGCRTEACGHTCSRAECQPSKDVLQNLIGQVRRLEEIIIKERETRDSMMLRERQAWEREVRILHEALATSYKSENSIRQRLLEIEDKVEANYDEQIRLRNQVETIDDVDMALEERVEELDHYRSKRRKIRHEHGRDSRVGPDGVKRTPEQDRSTVHRHSANPVQPQILRGSWYEQPESPRSSGILNLVTICKPPRMPRRHVNPWPRPLSPVTEDEPRSSGFLALDLADRLGLATAEAEHGQEAGSPEQQDNDDSCQSPAQVQTPPPGIVPPGPLSLPALLSSNGFVHTSKVNGISPTSTQRRSDGFMALDVLANVSAANSSVR